MTVNRLVIFSVKVWLKPIDFSAFYPLTKVNGNEDKHSAYSLPSALADGFVNVDFGL